MKQPVKTKYYTYSGNTHDTARSTSKSGDNIESGLQMALQMRKQPKRCSGCGNPLAYKGLGVYECVVCKEPVVTNYGKVRQVLDIQNTMTVPEICEQTGLTKAEIKELIDEGSIRVINGVVTV